MYSYRALLGAGLVALACLTPLRVPAQTPDLGEVKARFAAQQQKNEAALRQYAWKTRLEVQIKGEVKSTVLEMARYGASGNLETTVIGGSQAPPEKHKRGMRGRVQEKKKEKGAEYQQELKALLASYGHIPQDKLKAAMEKASFQIGTDDMAGSVGIMMENVVSPGDKISYWIDKQSGEKRKVTVLTQLGGDPVAVESRFAKLPDGTIYSKVSTVDIQSKQLHATKESFDFQRGK